MVKGSTKDRKGFKHIWGAVLLFLMAALATATVVFAADPSDNWESSGSYSLVIKKQFAKKASYVKRDENGVAILDENGDPLTEEVEIPKEVRDQAKDLKYKYKFRVVGYRWQKLAEGEDISGIPEEELRVSNGIYFKRVPIDTVLTIDGNSSDDTPVGDGTQQNDIESWKKSEPLYSSGPIHVSVTELTSDIQLNYNNRDYNMGDSFCESNVLFNGTPQVRDLKSNGRIVLKRPEEIGTGSDK